VLFGGLAKYSSISDIATIFFGSKRKIGVREDNREIIFLSDVDFLLPLMLQILRTCESLSSCSFIRT
jgi:hypothetical protein